MTQAPPVTFVATLYVPATEGGFSRFNGAKQTIISWARHVKYAGQLRVHIANDSVEVNDDHIESIKNHCPWDITVGHTRGGGLGKAFNEGVKEAMKHSPLVVYADDSYSLISDLDLTPWVEVLLRHEDIGAVGLMSPYPDQGGGRVVEFGNIRTETVRGIIFDRRPYTWNGRPFLYHERFFDAYQLSPEGGSGYDWEADYMRTFIDTPGPEVVYPFLEPWQHVWSGVRLGDKPAGWRSR